MTADLTGKKIAFLVDNAGVEQVELTAPWHAFLKAGAETVLIAPAKDVVQAFENDVEKADTFAGKPVAAICHGPWALVEADVVDGKRLTSYPSLKTDIRNAGGVWVDEEAVTSTENDWTLVTSRNPDDLDAFVEAAAEAFS